MEKFRDMKRELNEAALVDKNLILLRGIPGAGKSTFANLISGGDTEIICCEDDFFIEDGKYVWDPTKYEEAKEVCMDKCKELMEESARLVIVTNVNIREKDFKGYFDLADKYGYRVFSVIVENRHGNSSIHGVPGDTIKSMSRKFQISL